MDKIKKCNITSEEFYVYGKNLLEIDEVLNRKVVGIGNGAHINIPLKHKGKVARIIIFKEKNNGK